MSKLAEEVIAFTMPAWQAYRVGNSQTKTSRIGSFLGDSFACFPQRFSGIQIQDGELIDLGDSVKYLLSPQAAGLPRTGRAFRFGRVPSNPVQKLRNWTTHREGSENGGCPNAWVLGFHHWAAQFADVGVADTSQHSRCCGSTLRSIWQVRPSRKLPRLTQGPRASPSQLCQATSRESSWLKMFLV